MSLEKYIDEYNRKIAKKEQAHRKGKPLFANDDGQTKFAKMMRRKAPPKHKEIHED